MLAFIHIPKTAGSTMGGVLRSSYGINHCDVEPWRPWEGQQLRDFFSPDDLHRVRRLYPRLNSIAGHRVTPFMGLEKAAPDIRYFTILRDPIKRTLSWFQDTQRILVERGEKPVEFNEWIAKGAHRNHQVFMLSGRQSFEDAVRIIESEQIFIGLTERFDESLLFMQRFEAPELNINYTRRNVASSNRLADTLADDPDVVAHLQEANQEDIKLYRYALDQLFPRYRHRYGAQLTSELAALQSNAKSFNQRNLYINRLYRNTVYKPILRGFQRVPAGP